MVEFYAKGLSSDDYDILNQKTLYSDTYIVFAPYTRKASIEIGKDSGWCTTMGYSSKKDFWEEYTNKGNHFLYIIDKLNLTEDKSDKKGTSTKVDRTKQETPDCWAVYTENAIKTTYVDKGDNSSKTPNASFVKQIGLTTPEIMSMFSDHNSASDSVIVYPPKSEDDVVAALNTLKIYNNYTIHDDLSVSVSDDVYISSNSVSNMIYVKFNTVSGDFSCSDSPITTLQNVPRIVGGNFVVSGCSIKSLEHSPEVVHGDYYCNNTLVTSLTGISKTINGVFSCENSNLKEIGVIPRTLNCDLYLSDNKLTSLNGLSDHLTCVIDISKNKLSSLVGNEVTHCESFIFDNNEITSLKGSPRVVSNAFSCSDNKLTSLEDGPTSVGKFYGRNNTSRFTEDDVLSAMTVTKRTIDL
jgi:hypothetical protein